MCAPAHIHMYTGEVHPEISVSGHSQNLELNLHMDSGSWHTYSQEVIIMRSHFSYANS